MRKTKTVKQNIWNGQALIPHWVTYSYFEYKGSECDFVRESIELIV